MHQIIHNIFFLNISTNTKIKTKMIPKSTTYLNSLDALLFLYQSTYTDTINITNTINNLILLHQYKNLYFSDFNTDYRLVYFKMWTGRTQLCFHNYNNGK